MKNKFTFIDLFSGIGGFRFALTNLGGECLNFSEVNKDAIKTYCENYNEDENLNLGDITKIKKLPNHDLLTAGVPCQSWSIAGKNLGFEDDRGQLWNDTIYLLKESQPKAFIFENVKGLIDPRNKEAFNYIIKKIEEAGYFAKYFLLNSFDYGVSQNRVRLYIVGFKEKKYFDKFKIPKKIKNDKKLQDILENINEDNLLNNKYNSIENFSFNDLRNGPTTIHSWDILKTTNKQKEICLLLLKNRRKKTYGSLDGNPLSIEDFQKLNSDITQKDLDDLVEMNILKNKQYSFKFYNLNTNISLTKDEELFLSFLSVGKFNIDWIKKNKDIKKIKTSLDSIISSLLLKNVIICEETRYDFKNTKISTGLFGINRIFLPNSNIFPTLVASDTNDYIATTNLIINKEDNYKNKFIEEIYNTSKYRKISKKESCILQGFPTNFILPEKRNKWMKLIGNSVSIPVIERICKEICNTKVFEK